MTSPEITSQAGPRPIPAPPEFPVHWENPEDERLFWTRERVHYAGQVSPMLVSVGDEAWLPGWYAAAAAYDLPVVGPRGLTINTYMYTTMVPVLAPAEELAARAKRCQDKLGREMPRVGELWEEEWLPEVNQHIAYLERFDLAGATLQALRSRLEKAISRFRRVAEIHFQFHFVAIVPSVFDELYRDLLGSDQGLDAYRLLQGFDNKSLATGRALWALSRKALADPAVRAVFEQEAAAEVPSALEGSPAGRAFLAELNAFLAQYGQRCGRNDFDEPFWVEDPQPVIGTIRDYMSQPDRDLAADLTASAAERERLVAEARERLKGYPQPVVGQFEAVLKAAQAATVLSEDHGFALEYPSFYQLRRLFLEFGRRFAAAGVLEWPEDVFYLSLAELRETAAGLPGVDRHAVVAARRAEYARFRDVTPPPALGTPPPGPPPDNPMTRAIGKFFGSPPRPAGEPGVIVGTPGSPGKVRGTVKVVRGLAEAGKLEPGDILVAETTMPPWTPLFATAAAVVTDAGGVLGHCAVVAREYRIPAVVATGVATSVLRDGQTVEVDGDAGTVRVVS